MLRFFLLLEVKEIIFSIIQLDNQIELLREYNPTEFNWLHWKNRPVNCVMSRWGNINFVKYICRLHPNWKIVLNSWDIQDKML